jgi:uncharacterized protein
MPAQMPRITSLDVLRGVAVFGMLLVNIESFAMVSAARTNPTVTGPLTAASWIIWLATYVLADGKFMAVFSLLFGASICLLTDRAQRTGRPAARIHYRRMAVLFALGLMHAYGLWHGDILVALALCGAIAFLYRELSAPRLIALGVVVFGLGSVLAAGLAWWRLSRPDALAQALVYWSPSEQAMAWEISRYRGGWLTQMEHRAPYALSTLTSHLGGRELWRVTGLMLLGMGLFKRGIVSGERSLRFYRNMAVTGFVAGIPPILYGVAHTVARSWDLRDFRLVGDQLNYWGGVPVALGWIGTVLLLYRSGWLLTPMAAVGRMALTNYLMQTVICTFIFYGHGLGLFATVDRVGQLAIVAAIWVVQLAVSLWWMRSFALGPVEWLWRCLTYGEWLPIRVGRVDARHPAD